MKIHDDDGLVYELRRDDVRAERIRNILRAPAPEKNMSLDARMNAVLSETPQETLNHLALIAERGSISQVDLEREMEITTLLLRGRDIALSKRCKKWGIDYFVTSKGFARENRVFSMKPDTSAAVLKFMGRRYSKK